MRRRFRQWLFGLTATNWPAAPWTVPSASGTPRLLRHAAPCRPTEARGRGDLSVRHRAADGLLQPAILFDLHEAFLGRLGTRSFLHGKSSAGYDGPDDLRPFDLGFRRDHRNRRR